MKRYSVVVVLAAGLLASACQVAAADEAENLMKLYSWWEGSWKGETKVGGQVEDELDFSISRYDGFCHIIRGDGGVSLWGYDPTGGKWMGTGFNKEGGRFVTQLEDPETDEITPGLQVAARTEQWDKDGVKTISEGTWHYIDENTVRMSGTTISSDGKVHSKSVTTLKRQ